MLKLISEAKKAHIILLGYEDHRPDIFFSVILCGSDWIWMLAATAAIYSF